MKVVLSILLVFVFFDCAEISKEIIQHNKIISLINNQYSPFELILIILLFVVLIYHLFQLYSLYKKYTLYQENKKKYQIPLCNKALIGMYVKYQGVVQSMNQIEFNGDKFEFIKKIVKGTWWVKEKKPKKGLKFLSKTFLNEVTVEDFLVSNGKSSFFVRVKPKDLIKNIKLKLKNNSFEILKNIGFIHSKKIKKYVYQLEYLKKGDTVTIYGRLIKENGKYIITNTYNHKSPLTILLGKDIKFFKFDILNMIDNLFAIVVALYILFWVDISLFQSYDSISLLGVSILIVGFFKMIQKTIMGTYSILQFLIKGSFKMIQKIIIGIYSIRYYIIWFFILKELYPLIPVPTSTITAIEKVENQARKKSFLNNVRNKIIANNYYPRMALRRHIEGVVRVKFDIIANGEIRNIRFVSGRSIFYKSVRKTLGHTFPVDIPLNIRGEFPIFDVSITIHFNIQ